MGIGGKAVGPWSYPITCA